MDFIIEPMNSADKDAVLAIYQQGIETGLATFETAVPTWEKWDSGHLARSRFVVRRAGQVIGWAALSPVSSRCVYQGVAEVSVYVAAAARGQGVGKVLLQTLVNASEQDNLWTLQASLFPENEASLALHLSCGFRVVGRRERIAQLHGVWRDTLFLERRSPIIE
jgi:L-amino acid N-acyltransferase YncA